MGANHLEPEQMSVEKLFLQEKLLNTPLQGFITPRRRREQERREAMPCGFWTLWFLCYTDYLKTHPKLMWKQSRNVFFRCVPGKILLEKITHIFNIIMTIYSPLFSFKPINTSWKYRYEIFLWVLCHFDGRWQIKILNKYTHCGTLKCTSGSFFFFRVMDSVYSCHHSNKRNHYYFHHSIPNYFLSQFRP